MNYYCLIAGLPDIHAEETKALTPLPELKKELLEQLSDMDAILLRLLFANYDNRNLLNWLDNKEANLHPAGNLSANDWSDLIALMREFEHPKDTRLMPYIHTFYNTFSEEHIAEGSISREDYLSSLYYAYAMNCGNSFLRKWFEFNLNINNLLTGIACRKHGFDTKSLIIGQNEVANTIRLSNARDFGLSGMFDQLDTVMRIAEEENLLEREKKIDALKWEWLEENTFFHYFGVEKILAFVLKVEMIERWKMLSIEKGSQVFRQMLSNLKESAKFDQQNEI
ncbi:MAG: DUF2764 family protein [Paludibacteraceae bacterium]|nr:DUF2764 family protein [Paludibacteraceae bacterium]